jgi:hypothetical protein
MCGLTLGMTATLIANQLLGRGENLPIWQRISKDEPAFWHDSVWSTAAGGGSARDAA